MGALGVSQLKGSWRGMRWGPGSRCLLATDRTWVSSPGDAGHGERDWKRPGCTHFCSYLQMAQPGPQPNRCRGALVSALRSPWWGWGALRGHRQGNMRLPWETRSLLEALRVELCLLAPWATYHYFRKQIICRAFGFMKMQVGCTWGTQSSSSVSLSVCLSSSCRLLVL